MDYCTHTKEYRLLLLTKTQILHTIQASQFGRQTSGKFVGTKVDFPSGCQFPNLAWNTTGQLVLQDIEFVDLVQGSHFGWQLALELVLGEIKRGQIYQQSKFGRNGRGQQVSGWWML